VQHHISFLKISKTSTRTGYFSAADLATLHLMLDDCSRSLAFSSHVFFLTCMREGNNVGVLVEGLAGVLWLLPVYVQPQPSQLPRFHRLDHSL